LKIATQISFSNWESFIAAHPDGSVFQSPEMFELFEMTGKFEPLVLGACDDEGALCGILLGVFIHERRGPWKLLSSRFVVYGGPLLGGDEDRKRSCLDALLQELVERTRKKALFIQFRNFFDWQEYREVFEKHGFAYLERLNYIIGVRGPSASLRTGKGYGGRGTGTGNHAISNSPPPVGGGREGAEDREPKTEDHTISNSPPPVGGGREGAAGGEAGSRINVLQNMSTSRRRQIRKGLASGAVIIEPQNMDQLREFYAILSDLYRHKVRKPLPGRPFFENFYNLTSPRPPHPARSEAEIPPWRDTRTPIGIIRLVKYGDRIIGGILAPVTPGKCIYEWYVCGLDKEYKDQYPSVLATWAAIDYAIRNEIESFDFMGVGKPGKPYGVREFKARFGGETVNYGRFTRINNKFLYHIAELGYNVLALVKKI
jgi:hypothetical protein